MSVDIPDVWLSFDGNGKDFPVNVRNCSVTYDYPGMSLTYSASGSVSATVPTYRTVLTLDCEVSPPRAIWGYLIIGDEVVQISKFKFKTLGGDLMTIRLTIPDRGRPIVREMRWEPRFKTSYWGP